MKKYILIILVFSFGFNSNLSDLSIKDDGNSILWKIEKNGAVSYLFGTTHMMCNDEMKYENLLDELVQFADIVVFESGDDENEQPPSIGKSIFDTEIPELYKTKNALTRKELDEFLIFLERERLPSESKDFLLNTDLVSASWALALWCIYDELYRDCSEENITGSEIYIENIMKNQRTYYLEDDNELKLVMSMIINYVFLNKETNITIDEIIDAYEFDCYADSREILAKYYNNNDIKTEMEWIEREVSQRTDYTKVMNDAIDDILIKYRNELWIPKMEYIINNPYNENVLFAVGALHLFDLVERLRLRGYKVSALNVY